MSSGGFSDDEDASWGEAEPDKNVEHLNEGNDTPEDAGPPNVVHQQRDEENTQQEPEEETSDLEDDAVKGEKTPTDTQTEHVASNAETMHRRRPDGPAKSTQPEKLVASKKGSNDPKVISDKSPAVEEKMKGPSSVKTEATPPTAGNKPATTEMPKTLLDMTLRMRQILQQYTPHIAAAFLVAMIAIALVKICPTDDSGIADDKSYSDNANTTETFSDLTVKLNALKKRFPSQDEMLWSTVSNVLASNLSANQCSMLSLTSSVPFDSSPTARSTMDELASALPVVFAREHFALHHRQFTTMEEEQAKEAIDAIMLAWSTDVIVIHDVDSTPGYVMDVVKKTCQSNGVGHVVLTTSEEQPKMAESSVVAVRPEQDGAPLERISLGNPEEALAVTRRRFPAQPERVWQVVEAAILHHIAETNPVKPAVVILGAPPGAHRTADRLAETLAQVYTEKTMTIDSRQFANVDAARAKLHLDRVLDSALLGSDRHKSGILGSARAVVLTRLEALPGDAAMLFHGYCDHSDAQYKSVAYFFTVHCSEEIDPTLPYKKQERKVHEQLQRAWRNLPATHLDPLLGRITPMTTVVRPEEDMELSYE